MRKITKIINISLIAFVLSSCAKNNQAAHKAEYKVLANEGTICLVRESKHTLKGEYYPLNSKCKSSSKYSWKVNSIDFKVDANRVEVQSYSLYKESYPQVATQDCAGAGVKVNRVNTPNTPLEIYWDKDKIVTLKKIGRRVCFKRVAKKIVKTKI